MMIEISHLSKIYTPKNKEMEPHVALDSISLSFEKGEAIGIVGQNGSGKSTMLSILAGQIDQYEGVVKVNQVKAPHFTTTSPVSYAPEQPIFNTSWTVSDLFNFVGKLQGLNQTDLDSKIQETCEYFQLNKLLHDTFGSLSKGMRQRVNLAQSLISHSDLIVWDEPTSGLDWVFTDLIESKMNELKGLGKTIVFSSHDIHLTKNICDKLVYLKNGKLLFSGNFMEWHQYLYVSQDPLESRILKQI